MDLMVIEGDGIGPEIIKSALEVLNVLKENFNINLDPVLYDINSRNIANGKWKIEKILELANKHKAILKAPVGDPKIRNEYSTEVGIDAVLILRFKLDLYANIRPVKLLPGNNPVWSTITKYADATAQEMVLRPNRFNVIVTENMFGDILSNLAASTVGGLGVAYSANISDNQGMFEPVHGTAPDIAGKDIANPIAMLLSTCLMVDFLGFNKESKFVESSILNLVRKGIKLLI